MLNNLYNTWNCLYLLLLRPVIKWAIHKVTGKCELLRLTYAEPGAYRTKAVEQSLKLSKQLTSPWKQIQNAEDANIDEINQDIMRIKHIKHETHSKFMKVMKLFLNQLVGYQLLKVNVEQSRTKSYDYNDQQHEAMIMQLWDNLMPDTPLESRISKQWSEIGFQGDDPQTDFRGMGMLGLQNLVYFTTQHQEVARQLLSHSFHPKCGYSFAIVGINITSLTYDLLRKNHLKTHFYNSVQRVPNLDDFHCIYCYLFIEFDKFWFESKPKDIMEFNFVRDKFEKKIIDKLLDNNTVLRLKLSDLQ